MYRTPSSTSVSATPTSPQSPQSPRADRPKHSPTTSTKILLFLCLLVSFALLSIVYYEFNASGVHFLASKQQLLFSSQTRQSENILWETKRSILNLYGFRFDVSLSHLSNLIQNPRIVKPQVSSIIDFKNYDRVIFLDWSKQSHKLSYLNYKSLESLLVSYKTASFRLLTIGPSAANYYKIGDLLSKHVFEKYLKQGYDIKNIVVSEVEATEATGSSYWDVMKSIYTVLGRGVLSIKEKSLPPFHLLFYMRMMHILKSHGGIFYDLSWFHLRPLDPRINYGSVFKIFCSIDGQSAKAYESFSDQELQSANKVDCTVQSVFISKGQLYDIIPQCMLDKYRVFNNSTREFLPNQDGWTPNSDFMKCIYEDKYTEGATCIQKALEQCFSLHNWVVTNQFVNPHLPTTNLSCLYDVSEKNYFEIKALNDSLALLPCELLSIDDFSADSGFKEETLSMQKLFIDKISNFHLDHYQTPVLNYKFNSSTFVDIVPATALSLEPGLSGGIDNSDDWTTPESDSFLEKLIVLNNQLFLRDGVSHFSKRTATNHTKLNCHPFYQGNAVSKSGRASLSCSPSFVIPGFMKSASSFLFETLIHHPNVLHALQGVQFKETGCYLASQYKASSPAAAKDSRMNCFPFIEPKDSFLIYGDATVYYAHDKFVPERLRQDNPSIKAVFVVRDPIDRLQSHYRFSFQALNDNGIMSINEAVSWALREGSPLFEVRQEALKLVEHIQSTRDSNVVFLDTSNYHHKLSFTKSMTASLRQDFIQCEDPWFYFEKTDYCSELHARHNPSKKFHEMAIKMNQQQNSIFTAGAMEYTSTVKAIENFVTKYQKSVRVYEKTRKDSLTFGLITHSIFFPALAHWIKTLERSNILIVQSEKLNIFDSQKAVSHDIFLQEMGKVYRFLGIFDNAYRPAGKVNKTDKKKPGSTDSLNDTSKDMLKSYFAPFNQLLSILSQSCEMDPISY